MRVRTTRIFGTRVPSPSWAKLRRAGGQGLLAAAAVAALLPAAVQAQDSGPSPASAGVTFFTEPNFAGASKTLTLEPGQPYASIPFIGDELNEKIRSLRADPQIGTILFQRPYFASRDDVCGPNLGTREDRDAWWLGLTADFEPPFFTDQAYETAEMQDDDYSSVIAYRRDLGPPPGFLLIERRSYYNRQCESSGDQSYFNRLFIPVPNPPQREACTDLSTPASAYGAGANAPGFRRITKAVALFPENFSGSYPRIDHRFTLTLFEGPGCSGASITLPSSERGRPANYRVSDYDFDGKAKSAMVRYQRGPLDRYMEDAAAPAQTALTPAPSAPASSSATDAFSPTSPAAGATSQTPPAAQPSTAAPAPEASVPAGSPAPQASPAAPASGGLQPAPPTAPPRQQQVLQPLPELRVIPAPVAPSRPTGPQEETFRFPVHQVYRLNFCTIEEQGCGEPAANTWCEGRGFTSASRWTREDNIGALYPTVFIGNGSICDKFLCDGFEEITCTN